MLLMPSNRSKRGKWGGVRPGSGRKAELREPLPIGTDIEREALEQFDAIADAKGVTRARLLREVIMDYLKKLE